MLLLSSPRFAPTQLLPIDTAKQKIKRRQLFVTLLVNMIVKRNADIKDKGEKWIEAKAGCVEKCETCAANKAKPNKAKAQAKGKGTAKGTAKGTRKAPSAPSAQSGRSKDKAKAQTKGKGKAKGTAKKSTKRAPTKSTNKRAPTPHQERLNKAKGGRDGLRCIQQ